VLCVSKIYYDKKVYVTQSDLLAMWVYGCTLRFMINRDTATAPRFASSSVVIDWSKDKMQKKFDSNTLLQWVQSLPMQDDVHIYLGNVHFTGQRVLMRQLQALGCTVTCRQYQN